MQSGHAISADSTYSHPPVVVLDGSSSLPRELLGNKGYGINTMRQHGLPVPPAFAITTDVCRDFFSDPDHTLDLVWDDVLDKVRWLEAQTTRTFGRGPRPLLVSVRSGAAQSMPGMLDTVLDLGIDDTVERALAAAISVPFAADIRARFCSMYGRIVLNGAAIAVPDDPLVQLRDAIKAVFSSWNSTRARAYRRHYDLDDLAGTAVVVQAMVFGNFERDSGTGVLFSRNPMTGANEPFGEWLPRGQGEDVVSGSFDVEPVTGLRDEQPAVYEQLIASAHKLEQLHGDVQDIEFTVEEGALWLLQTRTAKRSAQAAVRVALQLRDEGLIDDAEALRRITPAHVETLLKPSLQPETRLGAALLATGLPASPGVVSGRAYCDVDEAIDAAAGGEDVILVRPYTSPDDVHGMIAAAAIVTEIGGATSHAAVVSREIGRPAVVGCGRDIGHSINGRIVTVDGTEGEVREGSLELSAWTEQGSPDLHALSEIALPLSPLKAYSDGDFPRLADNSKHEVRKAIDAGHGQVLSPAPLVTMLTAIQLAYGKEAR